VDAKGRGTGEHHSDQSQQTYDESQPNHSPTRE
jgi:hypothetical protein